MNVGVILLAAGAATRMGSVKQLLCFNGRTLLRHSAEVAVSSGLSPVVVVLGAAAEQLESELDDLHLHVVVNSQWQEGMGASIRAGMTKYHEVAPAAEGVVVTLCDQPRVGPAVIRGLVTAHRETGQPVVATRYADTVGVPAFFAREMFGPLERLTGQEGAKRVIIAAGERRHSIPFDGAASDIDTPADYAELLRASSGEET